MSKITVTTIAGLTSGGDANTVKIESGDAFNVVSGATTLGGATTISGDLAVDTDTLKVDTSNDRVGIGESAPSCDLVVKQSGSTFSTASQTVALFQRNSATGSGCKVTILSGNNTSGDLNFGDAEDEDIGKLAYEHNNNAMTFTTNTSERMRINSSGNIGINKTSPVSKLHINASANDLLTMERSGKSSGSGFANFNIETNSQFTLSYDDGGEFVIGASSDPSTQAGFTEHFRIASNGTLTATDTSIGSNSDERLKKNIADYTYDLEKFKQYKPKTFDWINPSNHNGKTGNRGFLAQDVKSIDDKWVGEFKINEKNPDYGIISDNVSLTSKLGDKDAMYISVIQQLITKVETLETKVKTLESK